MHSYYVASFWIADFNAEHGIVEPIAWLVSSEHEEKIYKHGQVVTFEEFAYEAELRELDHHPTVEFLIANERFHSGEKSRFGYHIIFKLKLKFFKY